MRLAVPSLILDMLSIFFRVGLCSHGFLTFLGDVGSRGALDLITMTEMPRSRHLESTRSSSRHVR